ncbi:MAG: hypothetical protein KGK18_05180 [Burkholderiales bacterium]|nr:hypothetical protein [Burkholderiales bacterium]
METAFLEGFATSAALFVAIGAPNAFVLRCAACSRDHLPGGTWTAASRG